MSQELWKAAEREVLGDDPKVHRRYRRALDACQAFAQACPDALAGSNVIDHLKAKSEAIERTWLASMKKRRTEDRP